MAADIVEDMPAMVLRLIQQLAVCNGDRNVVRSPTAGLATVGQPGLSPTHEIWQMTEKA